MPCVLATKPRFISGCRFDEWIDRRKRACIAECDREKRTFAERLRELLDQRRVSQTELAERTGCSQSAISHMLNRNSRPQKKTIFKLAEALQVEPAALWPDLEVAEILDQVAAFRQERQLTPEQALSVREAMERPAANVTARRLPARQRNR
ncbi:MAG: helix-turn-helix transcriptional regulator [Pirellulaceae bacterium]